MYKNVVVHQVVAVNRYQEIVSKGLGQKEWVTCYLPIKRRDFTYSVKFPTLCSGQVLFHLMTSLDTSVYSILNLPLVGFIYPIFIDMADDSYRYINDFEVHDEVAMRATWYLRDIECAFLALIISGKETSQIGNYNDPDWWEPKVRSLFVRNRVDMSRIRVAVCSIHHLDQLPYIIADRFELHPESIVDENPSSRLPHPLIPNATFNLKNLGCGEGASLGFIEDCLEGVVASEMPVRVWLDVKAGECTYQYDNRKVTLGPRYVTREPIEDGIHAYFEYEGCAFDSMMAFQEPISIYEFQKRLQSTWRTHIDITPDMWLDEAKSAVNESVDRVKRGIFT